MDQRGSRPYISLLKNVSDTIKTMYKYIFKYSEDLSCYCTTMKLACRGDDLSQDENYSFPIQQHASTGDFQENILLSCINPGPFVSTCSFIIKPKETVMIVYNINNTYYDIDNLLCFGEHANVMTEFQGLQECLCLFNNSNYKRIYVGKGCSLFSILKNQSIRNHIVHVDVSDFFYL